MHKVLVNSFDNFVQEKMWLGELTSHDMAIAVAKKWLDVKPQTNKKKILYNFRVPIYIKSELCLGVLKSCALHLYGLINPIGSWEPQNRSEGRESLFKEDKSKAGLNLGRT